MCIATVFLGDLQGCELCGSSAMILTASAMLFLLLLRPYFLSDSVMVGSEMKLLLLLHTISNFQFPFSNSFNVKQKYALFAFSYTTGHMYGLFGDKGNWENEKTKPVLNPLDLAQPAEQNSSPIRAEVNWPAGHYRLGGN